MKKLSLALSLLYGTSLLSGCASFTAESKNWTVEPFERVQHATHRPDGYYQLGRYYQGQNRLEQAAGAYRKALAMDPGFFEAHNGLGTIYASQGKYDQALAAFNSAIARAPDAAHVHNNIGYLKFLKGHYDEAVTAFSRATALDPTSQKAWNNLGMALAKNGDPMNSNQAFMRAIETTAAAQPAVGSAPDQVAAASGAVQPAPTLAVPKNRGVIDYTNTDRPEGNGTDRLTADNNDIKPAHPAPGILAQPAVQPPFAVIEAPNSSAMPVVMVNGSPYSATENVTVARVQPLPPEVKAPAVAHSTAQAVSAAPVLTAAKAEPETRDAASAKVTTAKVQPLPLEVKAAPVARSTVQAVSAAPVLAAVKSEPKIQKATPSRVIGTAAIPKERQFKLEVLNGNGTHRLAARVSSMLSDKGLPKASVGNHTSFNQARTVIHYRKGYRFEAARLSRHLRGTQHAVLIQESKTLSAKTDVKVVLGKDVSGKFYWMNKAWSMMLASR
jgi:Tfp pilus assembly protein PilF